MAVAKAEVKPVEEKSGIEIVDNTEAPHAHAAEAKGEERKLSETLTAVDYQ